MEIVVTDRMLERTVYIIIIMLLGVLLVLSYIGGGDCDATNNEAASADEAAAATVTEPSPEPAEPIVEEEPEPEVPEESCTDRVKNQDETDVDCGGASCDACDDGKACEIDADCESDLCSDNECTSLSGKVEMENLKVTALNSDSGASKVSRLTATIFNGKDEAVDVDIEIYAMTANKNYYIDKIDYDAEIDGPSTPYGQTSIGRIKPGESLDIDFDSAVLGTSYLYSVGGRYKPGDDFAIEVILIDQDNGDELVKEVIIKRV